MTDVAPAPRVRLSTEQLRLVNYIEQHWQRHGKFPLIPTLENNFPGAAQDVAEPHVVAALVNRGVKVPKPDAIPDELTEEQVTAVSLILDWTDHRSHNTKLRSIGVTPTKYQGWLKNPVFKEYLHSLSAQSLDDALNVAHEGLVKATAKGDVNAIKFYMELTGRFSSDTGQSQNFRVMIQRMVETIQRHVKDQDTIRLIAADFEVIMRGEQPATVPVLDRGHI